MALTYIYFGKSMTSDTGTNLMLAAKRLMGELDPQGQLKWNALQISLLLGAANREELSCSPFFTSRLQSSDCWRTV
jgi:hypothetical protein